MSVLIYQDPNQPTEARISDLLSRMTLAEKVRQLDMYPVADFVHRDDTGHATVSVDQLTAVVGDIGLGCVQSRDTTAVLNNAIQAHVIKHSRLGIPVLMSEEALHGLHRQGCTIFPQQIGLAATWNPTLAYAQGHSIAREVRALGIHETFSPVLDLARDPRWGRVEEGYGEDTYLGAAFAYQMVKGLQGEDVSAPDRIVAEVKHFSGYGQPTGGINCAPAAMGHHEHHAYCVPIFKAAFEAGALNAMVSYASIDGVPVAGDHHLLTEVLRGELDMKGFVRADMTAIRMLYSSHFVAPTLREAFRMAFEAGIDMQFYDVPHADYQAMLMELVQSGDMAEVVIDQAVSRVLRVKFLLGLFEQPYTDTTRFARVVRCEQHLKVALQVARESMTLLKNSQGLLPLSKHIGSIAVIGPSADEPRLGDYTGPYTKAETVTLLDGIRQLVSPETKVHYAQGCDILNNVIVPFGGDVLRTPDGQPGLLGAYYNTSDMAGEPALLRVDERVDFNWWFSPPGAGINANQYAVTWTGTLTPTTDLNNYLGLSTMDSLRLYVDDTLVIDGWDHNDSMTLLAPCALKAGQTYALRLEFKNQARGGRVVFGYSTGDRDMGEAVALAAQSDVAIVAVGDSEQTSGENLDRTSLELPGRQLELVKAIYATGTPVVLVLQNGRPLSLRWENEHLSAILTAWFPGQMGGQAMAEVLFGEVNPAGRLPLSFPKTVGQLPVHYNRKPAGGLRYVEMDYQPLFHFGHGLSYTTFAYENLQLSATEIGIDDSLTISFEVINTGTVAGDEVPQLYLRDVWTSVVTPRKELKGFTRIHLTPQERQTVYFTLGYKELRLLNRQFEWVVEPGLFTFMIGASSDDGRLFGQFQVTPSS